VESVEIARPGEKRGTAPRFSTDNFAGAQRRRMPTDPSIIVPLRSIDRQDAARLAAAQVGGLSEGARRRLASDIRYAIISYEQTAWRKTDRPADIRREIEGVLRLSSRPPTKSNIATLRRALKELSPSVLLYFGIIPDERSSDDPITSTLRNLRGNLPVLKRLIEDVLPIVPKDAGGPLEDQAAMMLMKRLAHIYGAHTHRPLRHSVDPDGVPKSEFTRLVFEVVKLVEPEISEAKADDCIRKILPLLQ